MHISGKFLWIDFNDAYLMKPTGLKIAHTAHAVGPPILTIDNGTVVLLILHLNYIYDTYDISLMTYLIGQRL